MRIIKETLLNNVYPEVDPRFRGDDRCFEVDPCLRGDDRCFEVDPCLRGNDVKETRE